MNFIKMFISTIVLSIGLKAYTVQTYSSTELASLISSSDITMQYYFFSVDSDAYLVKEKQDKTFALWFYTKERKWQPIHNASAFDGFPATTSNLSIISVNKSSEQITFGTIKSSVSDGQIKELLQKLENKTIKIGWYFWVNDKAFLIRKKPNNEISVWHYTNDRKWQPVHNASAFDGFPESGNTLESVTFNTTSHTLSTGSVINEDGYRVPPTPFAFGGQ